MQSVDGSPRSVIPRTRTARRQFVFGGVAFEVLADKTLRWELPADYERHVIEPGSTAVFADVICSVSVERGLPPIAALPCDVPCFRRCQERTEIFSADVRADLSRVAASRYAAAARVTPGTEGLSAMLLGVASAIATVEGGVCLRAAGLEFAGHAVLLLGPNAADVAAAANASAPAQLFCAQRVNLVWQTERWIAQSLPGRATSSLPASSQLSLPLAAVVRVMPGAKTPKLTPIDVSARGLWLQHAVELSDATADAEQARAERITRICHAIGMFELHWATGKPIGALLRSAVPTATG